MDMMKAVVKYDAKKGATRLMDMPVPVISDTDVLVEVAYIGVCGTDPHMHNNKTSIKLNLPLIFGHEFAGIIKKIGDDVKGYKIGDRVTAETHADYCGICQLCRTNNYHLCRDRKGYGFQIHGAFAKYVRVPGRILHRVPDNISLKEASLTEPLCVAYKALVFNSSINPGDSVVIIGPGPIGLLCTKIAEIQGAGEIIVIGTKGDDKRLQMAKKYGATRIINSSIDEPKDIILNFGDKYGVNLVVDTAGIAQTLDLSLDIVRPAGQITKIGWGIMPVNFSIDRLLAKSITLKGHFSHTWDVWEKCLELLKTCRVDLKPLITHELTIDKFEESFKLVESKQAIKVVLKPI